MIIDTNALSALAEQDNGIMVLLKHTPRIYLPVICLGEYQFGLRGSRKRSNNQAFLNAFLERWPLLLIEQATAALYAEICHELKLAGRPIPSNDIWIAALARQHAMPVVTKDLHFDHVSGLERLAW